MKIDGRMDSKKLVAFLTGLAAKDMDVQLELRQLIQVLCKMVVKEAKRRCPVDEGHLEKDIAYKTRNAPWGAEGQIYIKARESAEYSFKMHEDSYDLGELSKAKQLRESVRVGNKFLERAISENDTELQKIINEGLRAIINGKGGVK